MNIQRLNKLKVTATRTLLILKLIEQGKTEKEIVEQTDATRQLIQYYFKVTK